MSGGGRSIVEIHPPGVLNIEIVFAAALLAPQVFDKSYKGSNLALMVELLAGPLVGAAVADKLAERNWGNLVVALDPGLMGDRGLIRERMQAVLDRCGGVNMCGSVDPG